MAGLVFTFWKWLWEIEAECIFNCSVFNGPHVSCISLMAFLTHHQHLLSASSASVGSLEQYIPTHVGWCLGIEVTCLLLPWAHRPGQSLLTQARVVILSILKTLGTLATVLLLELLTTLGPLKQ